MTSTPATRADLPAQFLPGEVEAGLYARWVERGYFEADPKSDKPPFCIVIPPPNVTGSLHIGHAFEHTLIDLLIRRRRMQGYDALYLPGMDHASIAVHALVERALVEEGTSRRELGRAEFVRRVWQWKAESGGMILNQMRRLGDGVDWSRERFTLDEGLSRAVQTVFKQMFDAGLVYLAVGGGWTVLAWGGLRPLGFAAPIVLLTAVHFHYAGFALPLLTGLAGRNLPRGVWPARLLGELDTIDDVAPVARKLPALPLLHRGGPRLGELSGNAADLGAEFAPAIELGQQEKTGMSEKERREADQQRQHEQLGSDRMTRFGA